MTRSPLRLLILAVLLAALPAAAQWQEGGVPIADPAPASVPQIAPDGAGGLVVVWVSGEADPGLRAQRFDARGRALWAAGGVVVADPADGSAQRWPVVAPDGQGGAYVAWWDDRLATITTVFAQHVTADGTMAYAADGVALVSGLNFTVGSPAITPTADGGAVVAWIIDLSPVKHVRVQKLTPAGTAWAYGGLVVTGNTNALSRVGVAEFSGGRTAVCWTAWDGASNYEVRVAGVDAGGTVIWGPNLVFDRSGDETGWAIQADASDGVFISAHADSWRALVNYVDRDGDIAHDLGVYLCNVDAYEVAPFLAAAPDGVWATWYDVRAGAAIYVQRLNSDLDWILDPAGVPIVVDRDIPEPKSLIADGAGGALLAWLEGSPFHDADIYVQRVDPAGQPGWGDGVCLRRHEDISGLPLLASDGAGGLLAAFQEDDGAVVHTYVQRVERNGHWGYPAPAVAGVTDVPADQGGAVLLSWSASRLDTWSEAEVASYSLWRALPPAAAAGCAPAADWLAAATAPDRVKGLAAPVVRAEEADKATTYWLLLDTLDAWQLPGYAAVVPTLADSTAADPADQLFQVLAHGTAPGAWWASETATGRSVDNLAPAAPTHLTGAASYQPPALDLAWSPVAAPDLAAYVVHRGTSPAFVPGRFTLVATVTDTTCRDPAWTLDGGWYYKVAAVDAHGNAGGYAVLAPAGLAGSAAPAARTALGANHPNPFNPTTTIAYELAAAGPVRLRVYDAAGRLVRTLVDGRQPAGPSAATWDGRDAAGRSVASGVYLCRLEADGQVLARPLTLLK